MNLVKYKEEHKELLENLLTHPMKPPHFSLTDYPEHLVLAFSDQKLLGIGGYDSSRGIAEPFIFVHPDHRRKGYGRALMEFIESEFKDYEKLIHGQISIQGYHEDVILFLYKMGYYDWMIGDWMAYEGPKFRHRSLNVRPYKDDDYETFHRIESTTMFLLREGVGASHNFFYPASEHGKKCQLENAANTFILEMDHAIVGVATLHDNEIEVVSICPRHQGEGLGTEFTKYLLNVLIDRGHQRLVLEAMQGNPAKRIYERLGFKDTHNIHYMVKFYGEDHRLNTLPESYKDYLK